MNKLLEKREVLSTLNMYGFGVQEPIILSALIADLPILFYGSHGQMKTKGAELISKSILGKDSVFKPYDTARVSLQELLGIISPHSLQEDELRYIPSPHTVWGADAILMDEFTMATPVLGSIIHELVLSKTVMGMKTNIKLAFASCNPPNEYETHYMDLATCSRFILIRVPDPGHLSSEDLDRVLKNNDKFDEGNGLLKDIIEKGRGILFSSDNESKIRELVKSIALKLNRSKIKYSTRQSVFLNRMVQAFERLKILGYSTTDRDLVSIVMSTVPEHSRLVITPDNLNLKIVEHEIAATIAGFVIGDPLTSINTTITDLLKINTIDINGWCSAIIARGGIADKREIRQGLRYLKKEKQAFSTKQHVFNLIFHRLLKEYLKKSNGPKSMREEIISTKNIIKFINKL